LRMDGTPQPELMDILDEMAGAGESVYSLLVANGTRCISGVNIRILPVMGRCKLIPQKWRTLNNLELLWLHLSTNWLSREALEPPRASPALRDERA